MIRAPRHPGPGELIAAAAMKSPRTLACVLLAAGAIAPFHWQSLPPRAAGAAVWLGGSLLARVMRPRHALGVTLLVLVAVGHVGLATGTRKGWELDIVLFLVLGALASLDVARRLPLRAGYILAVGTVVDVIVLRTLSEGHRRDPIASASGYVVAYMLLLVLAPYARSRWAGVAMRVAGAAFLFWTWRRGWGRAGEIALVTVAGSAAAWLGPVQRGPEEEVEVRAAVACQRRPWLSALIVVPLWTLIAWAPGLSVRMFEFDAFRILVAVTLATHLIRPSRFGVEIFAPLLLGLAAAIATTEFRWYPYSGESLGSVLLTASVIAAFAWARWAPSVRWVRWIGAAAVAEIVVALVVLVGLDHRLALACAAVPFALSAIVHTTVRCRTACIVAFLTLPAVILLVQTLRPEVELKSSAELYGGLAGLGLALAATAALACGARRARWLTVIPEDHPVFTDARAPGTR